MTEIIATFKFKKVELDDMREFSGDEITDMFREIAEKSEMELISWGTI